MVLFGLGAVGLWEATSGLPGSAVSQAEASTVIGGAPCQNWNSTNCYALDQGCNSLAAFEEDTEEPFQITDRKEEKFESCGGNCGGRTTQLSMCEDS